VLEVVDDEGGLGSALTKSRIFTPLTSMRSLIHSSGNMSA